jgi:hypothetical protein
MIATRTVALSHAAGSRLPGLRAGLDGVPPLHRAAATGWI